MSVKSGQIIPLTAIAAADTVIATAVAASTFEVYCATIENQTAAPIVVELFLSADGTSAIGERIRYYTVNANSQQPVEPFGIPAGINLLAKAALAGLAIEGLYTLRNGDDA
jgi:hypothetical protein